MQSTAKYYPTSFQGTIRTTADDLIQVAKRLGADLPSEDDDHFELEFETEEGDFFIVYTGVRELSMYEVQDFKISADIKYIYYMAKSELEMEIEKNPD